MSDNKPPLLQIKEVSKIFRIKRGFLKKENLYALRSINMDIQEGETVGLVGESGSGKSTLGKIILRLELPSEGEVLFKGENIYRMGKEFGRYVSVIFQDPRGSLNPRMKVREIIEEPLKIHGYRERWKRIEEAMKLASLPVELSEKKPEELSGGQRQRVAIARAIVLNPKLIVADEPTSSLDVATQMEIISLINSLKNRGISILFITHDLRVVKKISDRIAVLYKGVLMEFGRAEEIFNDPKNPYTKYLLSSLPVKHPSERKVTEIEEIESEYGGKGCPFYTKCSEKLEECKESLRRNYVNGRYVACNLY